MNKSPDLCQVPGCPRYGNGEMTYKGNAVCSVHENIHLKGDGTYIWKKLGILKEMQEKELQVRLG